LYDDKRLWRLASPSGWVICVHRVVAVAREEDHASRKTAGKSESVSQCRAGEARMSESGSADSDTETASNLRAGDHRQNKEETRDDYAFTHAQHF